MDRLLDYRCTGCGVVDETLLADADATEERWSFCECKVDGMPVRKVRVYDIRRGDALDK